MNDLFFEKYMKIAIEEAGIAYREDEVPIGALLINEDEIIARNHNRNRQLTDPTAHAEILVLREASNKLGQFRLTGTTLFVTIEPCPMCAGAIIYSRVENVVYGAKDKKAGADGSVVNILRNKGFNHYVNVTDGILNDECAGILQSFFKNKRGKNN